MPDRPPPRAEPVLCVDVGSTWTKAALVTGGGAVLGTAQHPTTPPEVLHGVRAVADELAVAVPCGTPAPGRPWRADSASHALASSGVPVLACSSAGGGLRLAVIGQEPLVSAEAGRRVALSAGARVVHVHAGPLAGPDLRTLRRSRPDVVLLVGGTDGGDARTLLHNAARLAVNRVAVPIVLAGNAAARDDALALLRSTARTVVVASNVLPDVGELDPGPAREAIRAVFLRHVIGGKGLSRGPRFRRMVRLVTPDAVLVGIGRLAALQGVHPTGERGAVLAIDVGGATTDVYSAVSGQDGAAEEHAVALPPQRRTVEGDLGMRISAAGVVADALAERLIDATEASALREAAALRAADPGWVPGTEADAAVDARLAALAAVLAVRRHLRMIGGQLGPHGAGLLVLSGGVFRHAAPDILQTVIATLRGDPVLRPILRQATVRVDTDYVLAPAGLLAHSAHEPTADALLAHLL